MNNTRNDPDFARFHDIHPDIHRPSPEWRVAKSYPHMLETCLKVGKVIADPPQQDPLLCEYCGNVFVDKMEHYVCNCPHTSDEREQFWNIMNNEADIELAAFLFSVSDNELINILLGAPCRYLDNIKSHTDFLRISINYVAKIMDKITAFTL